MSMRRVALRFLMTASPALLIATTLSASPTYAVPDRSLTITDVEVHESNGHGVGAVFKVALSRKTGQVVTVDYATSDGTAVAGADYLPVSGSLTFDHKTLLLEIEVPIVGDVRDEDDETFFVNLTNPQSASIEDAQGRAVIFDDDAPPALTVSDASSLEGNLEGGLAIFALTLSEASGKQVAVDFATRDGTAGASDYLSAGGRLQVAPGTRVVEVPVQIVPDELDEQNENFFIDLSNPANASIDDGVGEATILNDDPAPAIVVSDAIVEETDSGSTVAVFSISVSDASGLVVSAEFSTVAVTATEGLDFEPRNGALTFLPGETSKQVAVVVLPDVLDEDDETFALRLSNVLNAVPGDTEGLGTILDNDAPPSLSIGDAAVLEGNSGLAAMVFPVSLSAASAKLVSASYETVNGSAVAPEDYVAATGTLDFPPGETERSVVVSIKGDTRAEFEETLFLNVSSVANAEFVRAGKGRVLADDPAFVIRGVNPVFDPFFGEIVFDAAVDEGDVGETTRTDFVVETVAPSAQNIEIDVTTQNCSATDGLGPTPPLPECTGGSGSLPDYLRESRTLVFAPGEMSKPVSVSVLGDNDQEGTETFDVRISERQQFPAPSRILRASARAAIFNDDGPPHLPSQCSGSFFHFGFCSFRHEGGDHVVAIRGRSIPATDTINVSIFFLEDGQTIPRHMLSCTGFLTCASAGLATTGPGWWSCHASGGARFGSGTFDCAVT